MVFSSIAFLSFFLPPVFLLCFALRKHIAAQNVLLTLASLLFYAWGEGLYVLGLIGLALINGLLATALGRVRNEAAKGALVAAAVLVDMGLLFAFKYAAFFAQAIGIAFDGVLPQMPLGCSFFTFQALSYVLDVRRGKTPPLRNYGKLLLYLCFFPQFIAGPIVQWRTVSRQFDQRSITPGDAAMGLRRFIIGLSKKVLLADVLARVVDFAFALPALQLSLPLAWLGAITYLLQIYLDFSGYSDMAVGLGRMFGFRFPENFRHPLRAQSVSDFWRRWHITLSTWFREYVYIPLGGNRHGKLRSLRNVAIVFLLTGMWHGAGWTFLLWGAFNAAFVLLEKMAVLRPARWPRFLRHAYVLVTMVFGFVLFRADTLPIAIAYCKQMLSGFTMDAQAWRLLVYQCAPMNLTCLAIGMVVSVNPLAGTLRRLESRAPFINAGYAACIVLLVASYASLVASGYHPFIYFRF